MDLDLARDRMAHSQIRTFEVLDPRVIDVFAALPRDRFVPEAYRQLAYADTQLPLGDGQVMMTPNVEGRVLQALELTAADRVLEVGTGSGFLAACLAQLAGQVESVDLREHFVARAAEVLGELGISNVSLETRDVHALAVEDAYDAIVVTASLPRMEHSFTRALRDGGRAFLIVGEAPAMEARLYRREGGAISMESLFETAIPALDGASGGPGFSF